LARSSHPAFAECRDLLRPPDAHELAHAERLQAIERPRGLAAEAVCRHIEYEPTRGYTTAGRHERIERITRRRREHEVRGAEGSRPVATVLVTVRGGADRGFAAVQRAHAPEEIRKALEIPGLL